MIDGQELVGAACAPTSWNANHHEVRRMVESFYEEDDEEVIASAKRICASCPVRGECLETGLAERYGIWGGMTPDERKQLRKTIRLR